MTGGERCQGTKPRMWIGADGGCGTEEKPCPVSRVPFSRSPARLPSNLDEITSLPLGINFYTQARKALSERSPFDSEDAQLTNNATTNLPHELARLVSKQFDSRKRQKRSHSHKHSVESTAKKVSGSTFWYEVEKFFRPLSVDDIDKLYDLSFFGFSASDKCLRIPFLGDASATNNMPNGDVKNVANCDSGEVFGLGSSIVKEEVKDETEQLIQVDNSGPHELKEETTCSSLRRDGHTSSVLQLTSGLEWLLGARNKIYLPSERPSKKRRLLGGDAGLEKLLVARPVEGSSSSLCHYCSLPDTGDQLNHLIVCSSCAMAVHERCYGVHECAVGSWLCSWCKKNSELVIPEYPCKLCPKQGGALKPVWSSGYLNDKGTFLEFAHLFCCQWMPEVYIGDTRKMEPILNVERIKETRRKLLCYICKRKHGACVRCSNGACRTSFHPICAREARNRMEIWGKFGCNDVELRAFCLKHSEVQNVNSAPQAVDSDLKINKVVTSMNKPYNLNIDKRNGDKIAVEGAYTETDKLIDDASIEDGWSDARSNSKGQSECGDVSEPTDGGNTRTNNADYLNLTNALNYSLILKKLIDREEVNAKEVASDIGITPDLLASMLAENCFEKVLHCKVVNWLRSHAYLGTSQNNLKVKIKPTIQIKSERGVIDDSDVITRSDSDVRDVPVKSVPLRRRTKSNIRNLKDNMVICSSKDISSDDGTVIDEINCGELVEGVSNCSNKDPVSVTVQKILDEPAINPCQSEVDLVKSEGGIVESAAISSIQNTLMNSVLQNPCNSAAINDIPHFIKVQDLCSSYIHPLIHNKLIQIQNGVLLKNSTCEFDGVKSRENSQFEASSSSGICCNHQSEHTTSNNLFTEIDVVNVEKMVNARNMGQFEVSPEDEVEEELIYHQHRLLWNAVRRKHLSDDLIFKIAKHLPVESDAVTKRKWDTVLVNQYLYELREEKKQGRKERRQKEAQAVLAAATAAAAASSRNSSFRKDIFEESPPQENMLQLDTSSIRAGFYSRQMLKNSDYARPDLDSSKEHPRTCDICRRLEMLLSPVLICSGCKVAVHLDCYRSVKETEGPWYCELCEDLLSRSSGPFAVNSWEKLNFIAECGLCGGTSGAFRRATDGQWVHAFCAEWVFESTFRRGQVNLIVGIEMIKKGIDVCHICSRRQGVCIKCNYGHCKSTFHPSCARSADFYMNVRTAGSKLQHKAYCEKHSLEQRAKADTQKHGVEEFKSLKQVRVELERLRLLCERIIKREKLKRELVLCCHGILASNRDSVALSALARRPLFSSDVSSESATTSLKGYTDDYKSGSEAMQRSDDATVDSTVSGKRRIKISMSMDNDQKTDDSFTSQHHFIPKATERPSFSGKQIPHRSSVSSRNFMDDGEKRIKFKKHTETFEKELLMTSDQACIKNQRLPKGFVYVPVRCLPKEKECVPDPGS